MKYANYNTEDFIKDEYFQKWVLDSDTMTDNFWANWLKRNPEKEKDIAKARKWVRLMARGEHKLTQADFNSMWQYIVEHKGHPAGQEGIRSSSPVSGQFFVLRAAAVFIGVISIVCGIYLSGIFTSEEDLPVISTSRITLELQDGTIKTVEENTSGVISTTQGEQVVNQQKNVLIYNKESGGGKEELVYNRLTVPYGKKFELVLSDGTHVFLNSGSRLRYPVRFLKDRPRDVFLDGEAFFTVTKDTEHPFTVITDVMNTQVYGTKFNVTSYKNEDNTSTVLVEGSVGVYRANSNKEDQPITIVPGERAMFKNSAIDVDKVDINKYTGWTEGKLIFVEDRFDLISKELERHFNVRITNQFMKLDHKRFTGTFVDESLEQILRIFQEHTPFEFSIQGKTVTIKPDN